MPNAIFWPNRDAVHLLPCPDMLAPDFCRYGRVMVATLMTARLFESRSAGCFAGSVGSVGRQVSEA